MAAAEERLETTVREFVADYLPMFLGLLSDQGVEPEKQRVRADRLVRSLTTAELAQDLRKNGRRVIVEVDEGTDPPGLTFNTSFVEDIDGDEALGLLETPIQAILELTSFRVNLLLQIDDADRRKSLINRARRSGGAELAGLADIPSVVELRLEVFLERLERASAVFARELDLTIDLRDAVQTVVSSDASSWPAWGEVAGSDFLEGPLEGLSDALSSAPSGPGAATTAEICWESLQLSPRSSLRQAAELLRGESGVVRDLGDTLRSFTEVLGTADVEIPEAAAEWREYGDVADAWRELFRREQEVLSWSPIGRETPTLSVFDAPRGSLGLDEPDSLPWQYPLLCWSVRERGALADLLEGTRSTLPNFERYDDATFEVETFTGLAPLDLDGERPDMSLDPAPDLTSRDDIDPALRKRATLACYGRLFRDFCELDRDDQERLLALMRSAYDGYFPDYEAVWERRFQAVDGYEPPRALRVLTRELVRILGPGLMFDPFDAPGELELSRVPSFVVIAPFVEDRSICYARVPLAALRNAFDQSPVRLRAVAVADAESGCAWLGDEMLELSKVASMSTARLLQTIERDSVYLELERA